MARPVAGEGISFEILEIPATALSTIMSGAEYELMEDGTGWFATIPEFEGLWGHGPSKQAAESDLASALPEWISLGTHLRHQLPKAANRVLGIAYSE